MSRTKITPREPGFAQRDEEKTSGVHSSTCAAAKTLQMLVLGAAGMACLLALLPAVGHDQLWCLYVAQRMLHGVRLYGPELLESNPPLVMWMLLVPAGIAEALHLPVTAVFKLFVVGLAVVSALVCCGLLRRLEPGLSRGALWGYGFAFITICGAMPARDFGQREHLLVLLCLPYIVAAALEATPGGSRNRIPAWAGTAIGIAAGLGLGLKPHHLLVPVAVEAAVALRLRTSPEGLRGAWRSLFRPEPLAIFGTCVAYLAAIRWLTPEYLTGILPILRDTYWAIGDLTVRQLAAEAIELHVLAAVAIGLWVVLRFARRFVPRSAEGTEGVNPLVPLLLAAGAASTVAYYVQGTGWYYQQIPALSFFGFALWVELTEVVGRWEIATPAWAPQATAGLAVLAVGLTAYFSGYRLSRPLSFPSGLSDTPDPGFFAGIAPGTPVAILTTVVDDSVPPVATYHLLWAQRQNNLWTLPAILRNESPAQPGDAEGSVPGPQRRLRQIPPERLAQLERTQHAWMVEDIERWHPQLILIARCQDPAVHCQIIEDRHDDLLAWFERDPAFRVEFAGYRYLRSTGPYDAYVPK